MTRKQAVLRYLQAHANQWVSGTTLVEVGSGWRYSARIYELRKEGYVIEERPDPRKWSSVHQYRLVDERQLPLFGEAA